MEDLENRIYDHQEAVIAAEYGEEQKNIANYGNGVTEFDKGLMVETKVYGASKRLVTIGYYDQEDFEDSWEGY